MKLTAMNGNDAAAAGASLARVQVVAAYPITPQTPIVENLATAIDKGDLKANYINVESEHSALCATVGASLVGARAFTATASAGLALMHEITGVAAGCRQPIVMPVVNRAIPSPWSLWCDHSDIMGERDQGWIQLFAETCQEALDFVILSYRLAEDKRVQLPVMIGIDGFFLSHITEPVDVPSQEQVDAYLPPREPHNLVLDVDNPLAINTLTPPGLFTEIKYQHKQAMENAAVVMGEVFASFAAAFGRKYSAVKEYKTEDADIVFVAMGTMAGTGRDAVDALRSQGHKVGILRITSFRPFPTGAVQDALKETDKVIVLDRSAGLGSTPPLALEVSRAVPGKSFTSCVAGLGGRDVTIATYEQALSMTGKPGVNWLDLKEGE
ncbi:MAG: transketolase C-terminal domain-containing protein [Eubacteriales bacterium]|nr:transketolase C-terminal domain-containing protein [Eubacteriales bacterium]